jgi:hypothetical protein
MLMNSADRPAVLHFEPNGFRVVRPGGFVLCAVSGERIALDTLRYWSVDLQEAYASPAIATHRLLGSG